MIQLSSARRHVEQKFRTRDVVHGGEICRRGRPSERRRSECWVVHSKGWHKACGHENHEVHTKQDAKDENGKPRQTRRGVTTEVENPGRLYDMMQQNGLIN